MLTTNPFAELAATVPSITIQLFVITMILLVIIGTFMDILHKKNVKYFFQNAQKAKKQAKRNLDLGEKTTIIFKTIGSDILTTAELGAGKEGLLIYLACMVLFYFGFLQL